MRDIIRTAYSVAETGHSALLGGIEEYVKEVEKSFFNLTNDAKTGKMSKLNSCLKTNLKELEDTSRGAGELSGT